MKKVTYEEFADLVKEDFRKSYEGRRPMDEVNDYLDNDIDAKDAIEGEYDSYESGVFSEGLTPEEFLRACVSTASYNASLCF